MTMYLLEAPKQVSVDDLGISIGPSSPKTISDEQYRSSVCLTELVRRGMLKASPISLCREEVPSKPQRKKKILDIIPPAQNPIKAPPTHRESYERPIPKAEAPVARGNYISRDELSQVVSEVVKKTVEALIQAGPLSAPPQKEAPKRQASPAEPSAPKPKKPAPLKEEEFQVNGADPMFIPTGMVPKDVSGSVSVTSNSHSSEELGEAASALKRLRGRPS